MQKLPSSELLSWFTTATQQNLFPPPAAKLIEYLFLCRWSDWLQHSPSL